ncbi:hypothetical protein LCGC14_2473800, partial [marine sediment metagenome]
EGRISENGMSMPKVYLAGPIAGCSWDEAMDWRKYARTPSGCEVVSPLRCEGYLQGSKKLPNDTDEPMSTGHAITVRSHWDSVKADVVLANFIDAKSVSIGSCFELAWAWEARIPCVIVLDELHDHPFVRESAYAVLNCVDTAIDSVLKLLNKDRFLRKEISLNA